MAGDQESAPRNGEPRRSDATTPARNRTAQLAGIDAGLAKSAGFTAVTELMKSSSAARFAGIGTMSELMKSSSSARFAGIDAGLAKSAGFTAVTELMKSSSSARFAGICSRSGARRRRRDRGATVGGSRPRRRRWRGRRRRLPRTFGDVARWTWSEGPFGWGRLGRGARGRRAGRGPLRELGPKRTAKKARAAPTQGGSPGRRQLVASHSGPLRPPSGGPGRRVSNSYARDLGPPVHRPPARGAC